MSESWEILIFIFYTYLDFSNDFNDQICKQKYNNKKKTLKNLKNNKAKGEGRQLTVLEPILCMLETCIQSMPGLSSTMQGTGSPKHCAE